MAVMRLPAAAEQQTPGCEAAVEEAGEVPEVWGKGVVGTFELELLQTGRKVGFHLTTPSVKQTKPLINLASEFVVVSPSRLGNVMMRKEPEISLTTAF